MSYAARARNAASRTRTRCAVGRAYNSALHDPAEAEALQQMIDDPRVTLQVLVDAVAGETGSPVDRSGAWRHRNGECGCRPGDGRPL